MEKCDNDRGENLTVYKPRRGVERERENRLAYIAPTDITSSRFVIPVYLVQITVSYKFPNIYMYVELKY